MAYIERLEAKRNHYAELACKHAVALLYCKPDERDMILEAMRLYGGERDKYAQQIAWENRRTGWVWPMQPAWTN